MRRSSLLGINTSDVIDSGVSWIVILGWIATIYRLYDEMINAPYITNWSELFRSEITDMALCAHFLGCMGALLLGPIVIFANYTRRIHTPTFIILTFCLYTLISAIGCTVIIGLMHAAPSVPIPFMIYNTLSLMYSGTVVIGAIIKTPGDVCAIPRMIMLLYSVVLYNVLFTLTPAPRPTWCYVLIIAACNWLVPVVLVLATEIFLQVKTALTRAV